uniref:U6 snRNA phosphodiesterase 1 n=1 Tax=Kalanchoe fedtschenkoi TaxID=63787 RepID=A0A7N0UAR3_KALFE
MDALIASYGDDSGSDSDCDPAAPVPNKSLVSGVLPPPPVDLLSTPNSSAVEFLQKDRIRSFAHVEGNYALHVFIPVYIPSAAKKGLAQLLKKLVSCMPDLSAIDVDVPLNILCKDDEKLEQIALGREFHISLGRTVPVRVHQINSMVSMLRQRLQFQRRYKIDFTNFEIFVNDDHTRTFVSLEVTAAGLSEVQLVFFPLSYLC